MVSTPVEMAGSKSFVTLGMFIIDEFSFADENGEPTGRTLEPQIGGGGTYAAIGARIWLPASKIGMVVDKGDDFPEDIENKLLEYGKDIWMFRKQASRGTTRALNSYRGEERGFEYRTPRIRITPNDFKDTLLEKPRMLHFICSPARASAIMSEVTGYWEPTTLYEPIPDRCVPEELPALKEVLPFISILSPNAEEALSLLSLPLPVSKGLVERAAHEFLEMGVGKNGSGWVIIRSGSLGAFAKSQNTNGVWIDAFWTSDDAGRIVDVTGAGNSFLGGLAAGLELAGGDVLQAVLYASVSASFVIEQEGLPILSFEEADEIWNNDKALRRFREMQIRHGYKAN